MLEARFGVNRYCSYLEGREQCPRPDCLFLHQRRRDSELPLPQNQLLPHPNCEIVVSSDTVLPRAVIIGKNKKSRFVFARDEGEDDLVKPKSVPLMAKMSSPSQQVARLTEQMLAEMTSHHWAADLFDIVGRHGHCVLLSPKVSVPT